MDENQSISDMIRSVADNNYNFLYSVAEHIEKLQERLDGLQSENSDDTDLDNGTGLDFTEE
jgi:hypothetical protein